MKTLPFKHSPVATIGIELEYQLIDPLTYDLTSRAKDLMRNISNSSFKTRIKPEITQSMIEVNSSIHQSPRDAYDEIAEIRSFLLNQAKKVNVCFSGGGTHPFQKWSLRKIFPTKRYKKLSKQYQYLSKRSTVFGQHIHIGCANGDDALYLTHALARYVPHFIALSASSPFYQGVDTGYQTSRSTIFNAFPLSGVIPYFMTWQEFSAYFYKMSKLKIIESMKDVYWDIRPKPEFGTVEIRVCDTPLTIEKSVMITAYIQSLAHYLLLEKPIAITPDLYHLYNYNRFQASRYGFDGEFINPYTLKRKFIGKDILETIKIIKDHIIELDNTNLISRLSDNVINKNNDTTILRELYKQSGSFPELVHEQCLLWSGDESL